MDDKVLQEILLTIATYKQEVIFIEAWYTYLIHFTTALIVTILVNIFLNWLFARVNNIVLIVAIFATIVLISFILPSYILLFTPHSALWVVGLGGVSNLQKLSFQQWQMVAQIFRIVSWMGGGTLLLTLINLIVLVNQGPNKKQKSTMQQKDVLTPVPDTLYNTNNGDNLEVITPTPTASWEITPSPEEDLPVIAWLESLAYGANKERGVIFPITLSTTRLGKTRQIGKNDISLPEDIHISGTHCLIQYQNNNFVFTDQSRHGSKVNHKKIKDQKVPLSNGTLLTLGKSKFLFYLLPQPQITILNGQHKGEIWSEHPPLAFAKQSWIDINYQKKQYELHSTYQNSILINNKAIDTSQPWPLTEGDQIKLEDNIFLFTHKQKEA